MPDPSGTFGDGDEIAKRHSVMRKHFLMLLAAAIGLAASQASAADVPRKAPAVVPPAPPLIAWTGCYTVPTWAGYSAVPRRLSVWEMSLQTILALLVAVKLA